MVRRLTTLLFMAVLIASAQAKSSPAPKRRAASKAAKKPVAAYKVDEVNDPAKQPDLASKAVGSAVLRAQILLDRANFSVGEIDGTLGNNMESALSGFRTKRQIAGASG